jgi:hypothetical protein
VGVSRNEEGSDILGTYSRDIHDLERRLSSHADCFHLVDFAVGVILDLAWPQTGSLSADLGLPPQLGLSLTSFG